MAQPAMDTRVDRLQWYMFSLPGCSSPSVNPGNLDVLDEVARGEFAVAARR